LSAPSYDSFPGGADPVLAHLPRRLSDIVVRSYAYDQDAHDLLDRQGDGYGRPAPIRANGTEAAGPS